MGNKFEPTVIADDEAWAMDCIDAAIAEIRRIEKPLTTFSEDSETALGLVAVEKILFPLTQNQKKPRSVNIYIISPL